MGSRYTGKTCRLLCMLIITSAFFLVEISVGYITNSIALVADSFHMLSDVVALIIGFASIRISKWPSRKNTFGWVRAEVLGALVNSVFLLALCFSILVESLQRLVKVEEIEQPILLLVVGCVGLVVNLVGLCLFHTHSHGHSHGGSSQSHVKISQTEESTTLVMQTSIRSSAAHSSSVQIDIADLEKNRSGAAAQMNMRGVFLHVLGDALGSVVVIISSLVILLAQGSWRYYVDPAMSIAMVLLILATTIPLLKQSSLILLQTTPSFLDQEALKKKLGEVDGVLGIHEFHVWQLAGNRIVLSAHITCHNMWEYMSIAAVVKDLFHKEGIHSTTIQPEFVEVSEKELCECRLPCIDQNRDCLQDTCCGGTTPKTRPKEKFRKDRWGSSSGKIVATGSQSAPLHISTGEESKVLGEVTPNVLEISEETALRADEGPKINV